MADLKANEQKPDNTVTLGILKADEVYPELAGIYGQYPDMFTRLFEQVGADFSIQVFDAINGQLPQHADDADAYLVTGSKFSAFEDLTWINDLKCFVCELQAAGKPLLGICFGHQLISAALGGTVERSTKGWGLGTYDVELESSLPGYINAEQYRIAHSHQDQVTVAAPGSRLLGGSAFCPNGMLTIDDHILTLQGHPEFTRDYGLALIEYRRERFDDSLYQQARASYDIDDYEQQRLQVARWMAAFLREKIA